MFRSGLVGFTLHGSLSHYYYQFCEVIIVVYVLLVGLFVGFLRMAYIVCFCFQALFPFQDWWVVPAKVAFDQTVWAAIWNSIYFVVLGLLRFESPSNIFNELKTTFWPLLTVRNHSYFPLHLV
jgi:protein Mpv17